mmetsp:Transcript_14176/g.35190  ORF Transcript_14176/g.35190 Transcript_14176/m.35190 type:complete len:249 (-) Transcript_14176:322-1068(-)
MGSSVAVRIALRFSAVPFPESRAPARCFLSVARFSRPAAARDLRCIGPLQLLSCQLHPPPRQLSHLLPPRVFPSPAAARSRRTACFPTRPAACTAVRCRTCTSAASVPSSRRAGTCSCTPLGLAARRRTAPASVSTTSVPDRRPPTTSSSSPPPLQLQHLQPVRGERLSRPVGFRGRRAVARARPVPACRAGPRGGAAAAAWPADRRRAPRSWDRDSSGSGSGTDWAGCSPARGTAAREMLCEKLFLC